MCPTKGITNILLEVDGLSLKISFLFAFGCALFAIGCKESSDNPDDHIDTTSEESTTEGGRQTDSDVSEESDEALPCLGGISGRVLKDGTEGIKVLVVVCMGFDICHGPQVTKADGTIEWIYPDMKDGETCIHHDFAGDEWLHIELLAQENPENYAAYSFVMRPTTSDISDGGSDDFTLDVGDLALYELSASSETFVPSSGVVVDLEGVSFELPPEGLVKESLNGEVSPLEYEHEIRVFKAPLEQWDAPFLETTPDALYFIGPRWAQVDDPGVTLSLEPPDGWSDGDVGKMILLGSWRTDYATSEGLIHSDYMYRTVDGLCVNDSEGNEQIAEGFVAECGEIEMTNGRIVTPPIPRLTWIAISK